MPDIWSGIGADISPGKEGEWLYQVHGQIRGPVPMQVLAQKLVKGEVGLNTLVAKEGGEFHPVSRVAAFATHITEAKKQAHKRGAKKARRVLMILALPVLAALGVTGWFIYQDVLHKRVEAEKAAKLKAEELERQRALAGQIDKMELVALVSLGSEDSVKIKSSATPAPSKGKSPGKRPREEVQEEDTSFAQCQLSQGDIFGTLKKNLAKINVCVEEEKKTDTQGLLPPTLELEFVVQTSGKVAEFSINDRHYRKGPLNNCMTKVFNTLAFPSSKGANCPVSIPIKIGK